MDIQKDDYAVLPDNKDRVISITSKRNKSQLCCRDVSEMTGQDIVNAVSEIDLFENGVMVIPVSWFWRITNSKGYADIPTLLVLGHILYWYRPRKDGTKRFVGERLEVVYSQLQERFNLAKRTFQNAFDKLENMGIIKRELINKNVRGVRLNNIQRLTIIPEKLSEITSGNLQVPSCENYTTLVTNRNEDSADLGLPSCRNRMTNSKNIIDNINIIHGGLNDGMNGAEYFLESTKRRIEYNSLAIELNSKEMKYVDIMVEAITEAIVGHKDDIRIKIAGDYPERVNVIPRLLQYRKQEVLTVAKNICRRKQGKEIADIKSYLLKALDAELTKNNPLENTVREICSR